ncbi:MAG: hypothetical protein ACO3AS_06900 [Burkholderiaceae bacterium]|jgi:hypothetical protein
MAHQQHPNTSRAMLSWLERDPQGAALLRQAQTLSRLQDQLRAHTGLQLEVCGLRERVVVVFASGAMAARLRQQAPSLLRFLRTQGWSLEEIKIKARPYSPKPAFVIAPRGGLSAKARSELSALRTKIHHPGLAQSLKGLLRKANQA